MKKKPSGPSTPRVPEIHHTLTDTKEGFDHFFLPDFCALQPILLLIIFSQLLSMTFVLVREPLLPFPWTPLAITSTFILWITLTTAGFWCGLRTRLMQRAEPIAAVICFLIVLFVTIAFSVIGQWLLPLQGFDWRIFNLYWPTTVKHVIIAAIIGGLILRYFYLSGQLEKQRRSELLHRVQALQSRIQPHFFFNSMNIIASLIDTDPKAAETVVEDLAEVFRASLNEVQNQVALQHEIDVCRRYLNIEQLRLGERLEVIWDLPETFPEKINIPMLTIQPLLENAIYHGIQHLPEGGTITISLRIEAPWITIKVRNPMPTDALHHPHGNRIAIDNIRHRLTALYGPDATLKQRLEASWYCVEIRYRVPQ